MLPENLNEFIHHFSRLPGIGRKTAERLGFYILSQSEDYAEDIAESIRNLKTESRICSRCGNISDSDPCFICRDASREDSTVCVVETAMDIYFIEESGGFKGKYHVLGGLISPLDGMTPDVLNFKQLDERIRSDQVKELIVATSPTTEGDTTALYIKEMYSGLGVRVTHLARGIPIGTGLQFAGSQSISQAIKHREEI